MGAFNWVLRKAFDFVSGLAALLDEVPGIDGIQDRVENWASGFKVEVSNVDLARSTGLEEALENFRKSPTDGIGYYPDFKALGSDGKRFYEWEPPGSQGDGGEDAAEEVEADETTPEDRLKQYAEHYKRLYDFGDITGSLYEQALVDLVQAAGGKYTDQGSGFYYSLMSLRDKLYPEAEPEVDTLGGGGAGTEVDPFDEAARIEDNMRALGMIDDAKWASILKGRVQHYGLLSDRGTRYELDLRKLLTPPEDTSYEDEQERLRKQDQYESDLYSTHGDAERYIKYLNSRYAQEGDSLTPGGMKLYNTISRVQADVERKRQQDIAAEEQLVQDARDLEDRQYAIGDPSMDMDRYIEILRNRIQEFGGSTTERGFAAWSKLQRVLKEQEDLYVVLKSDDKPDRVLRAERGQVATRPKGAC